MPTFIYASTNCTPTTTCTTNVWTTVNITAATTATGTTWYSNSQTNCHYIDQQAYYNQQMAAQRARDKAAEKEQDDYQRALAEHDQQEIDRIERLRAERQRIVDERNRQAAEQAQAYKVEQERKEVAKKRAHELLLEHLSPVQQDTLKKNGWFVVEGGKTKRKYRIRDNTLVANVDVLDNTDKVQHRLCAHPRNDVCPMGDHLLAQKMTLELDEDAFLRVANRHG